MDTGEAYRLLIADVLELAGAVRRSSESIAKPLGQSTARWHALSVFSDKASTVSAASRRLGLARQNVQRVVGDLVAEGLLSLETNPDHRAAPLIVTTEAGREVLAALVKASDADRTRNLDTLEVRPEQLIQARETLRSVLAAVNRVSP